MIWARGEAYSDMLVCDDEKDIVAALKYIWRQRVITF